MKHRGIDSHEGFSHGRQGQPVEMAALWCGCDVFVRERPFLQFSLESLSLFGADDDGWVSILPFASETYIISWWHTWGIVPPKGLAVFWSWPEVNILSSTKRIHWWCEIYCQLSNEILLYHCASWMSAVWIADSDWFFKTIFFFLLFLVFFRRRVWWSHLPLSALSHSFTCRNGHFVQFHLVFIEIFGCYARLETWLRNDHPNWTAILSSLFSWYSILLGSPRGWWI